ncbi:MAG: AgmX/PglI C-terminal domain-containing protein [Deltaproteobacteria bacterium]|nr:AgmX/PglI C-terminal domain-containing protein [Deltaproteobacteria bacterium]
MSKPILAAAVLLALVAPAAADQGPVNLKLGQAYDLPQREHKKQLPKDSETAKPKMLSLAQVAAVVKARGEEVAYCWDRLPPSQRVAGTAVLKFSIEPTGKVADLAIAGDAPDAAVSCLSDCARRWAFPAADAKSELEYPIRLK